MVVGINGQTDTLIRFKVILIQLEARHGLLELPLFPSSRKDRNYLKNVN